MFNALELSIIFRSQAAVPCLTHSEAEIMCTWNRN